ncbi:DUF2382 domain-containing protein [Oscillatoria sp. FACHB-1407]|uniref:DUF2382 domain-containing protein n=1 Tax=Oscillatoria sp. FACHB-1407 TaxID=2692847 RepID=UPI001684BFD6|nr:DUF2382 domain-containing protein [Oscillatoria sp. FACHB-1407]MBD2460933.1 DUF2382 domain-containing protein [Oscillatoria sp. FACHB-1407]
MALYKLRDFNPDYRNYFDNQDILSFDLYNGSDKIGSIDELLVDDEGRFRYFVINTGVWVFGKKVLLPIGQSRISYSDRRVYVDSLTREQVEQLPEFNNDMLIDYDYEENVRGVYRRPSTATTEDANYSTNVESTGAVDTSSTMAASAGTVDTSASMATPGIYDRDTYDYNRDAALYNMNDRDHQNLRLFEERLIANKTRQKTGEVTVGKHVETQRANVEVPVDKERVVIERGSVTDMGRPVAPGEATFAEGEVARMEVYEEVPDIRKEAFVREEVTVRKEVDHDRAVAEDEIRREELDVHTEGRPVVNKRPEDRI